MIKFCFVFYALPIAYLLPSLEAPLSTFTPVAFSPSKLINPNLKKKKTKNLLVAL